MDSDTLPMCEEYRFLVLLHINVYVCCQHMDMCKMRSLLNIKYFTHENGKKLNF